MSRRSTTALSSAGIVQAACLLGLAACLVPALSPDRLEDDRPALLVHGLVEVPDGCAVGSSGPTLNPRNAIRHARLSAIEALAMDRLEVDVQAISGIGPHGSFEIASQALSGGLRDARIIALWAKPGSNLLDSNRRRLSRVFALACWPDASLRGLPETVYPQWLIEPPRRDGQICAAGIGGPTRKPAEQSKSALRDARGALAIALESRIEVRLLDVGHGAAKIAREIDPSTEALRRSETASRLEEEWMDEEGLGPIGLPGVLYGLACIED